MRKRSWDDLELFVKAMFMYRKLELFVLALTYQVSSSKNGETIYDFNNEYS